MVSRLTHENVIKLLGYCVDGNLRVLAYEYATMGSLHDILHGKSYHIVFLKNPISKGLFCNLPTYLANYEISLVAC